MNKNRKTTASVNPGMRSLLRGKAHALMNRAGLRKVNRERYVMMKGVPGKIPYYFAENWREWAGRPV